jgi:hypothetical protein
MNETAHIGEAARQLGVGPEHLHTSERGEGTSRPRIGISTGGICTEFGTELLRSMVIGARPREVCRRLEGGHARVGHRSPQQELLAREGGAMSEQEDAERRGEVVANAQMCRI